LELEHVLSWTPAAAGELWKCSWGVEEVESKVGSE
jgi:hypothetical protein